MLMTRDFELKLCDFGSSSFSLNNVRTSKWCEIRCPMQAIGSPEFNAPEVNYETIELDKNSLEKADVFSLASALFLMVSCLI